MSESSSSSIPEERGVSYFVNVLCAENSEKRFCIGVKRYGGLFCKRCEISLLEEGEESARYAGKIHYDKCPLCHTPAITEDVGAVQECMCFDWQMAPHRLAQAKFRNCPIVDSFGNKFMVEFFLNSIVKSCHVQFYDKIEKSAPCWV